MMQVGAAQMSMGGLSSLSLSMMDVAALDRMPSSGTVGEGILVETTTATESASDTPDVANSRGGGAASGEESASGNASAENSTSKSAAAMVSVIGAVAIMAVGAALWVKSRSRDMSLSVTSSSVTV